MIKKRLTFDEAKELIKRDILNINNVHIVVDKYSKNIMNDWIIESYNIDEINKRVLFTIIDSKLAKLSTTKTYIVPHYLITKISDMDIKSVLEAYDIKTITYAIEILTETDVVNNVIGKSNVIINDVKLTDGLHLIFHNDKTEKYNNRMFTVRDSNTSLKLVAKRGRPKKSCNS